MAIKPRELKDLISVGKATLEDFQKLGISTVDELAKKDACELYLHLAEITGKKQDPCVEDVFAAAIAQARDPNLPHEKCQWWYWSRMRKKSNIAKR